MRNSFLAQQSYRRIFHAASFTPIQKAFCVHSTRTLVGAFVVLPGCECQTCQFPGPVVYSSSVFFL